MPEADGDLSAGRRSARLPDLTWTLLSIDVEQYTGGWVVVERRQMNGIVTPTGEHAITLRESEPFLTRWGARREALRRVPGHGRAPVRERVWSRDEPQPRLPDPWR